MEHRNLTRVVCCQGTIQLAVACHVLLYRQKKEFALNPPSFRNFLVVYDLFTIEKQEMDFFDAIRRMAQVEMPWENIVYLNPKTIDSLNELFKAKGKSAFDCEMEKLLGIKAADEIYISRNWQIGNLLMLNAFCKAFKICYGDSIGLYFPETYFSDTDWWTRFRLSGPGQSLVSVRNHIVNVLKYPRRKPLFEILHSYQFDYGYFCFDQIAGISPPFKYEIMDVSTLKTTFERFMENLSLDLSPNIHLTENLSVLLTSNFSEAKRMDLEDELSSYIQFVKSGQQQKGTILLKPHPRDSQQKIELLKRRLIEESFSVIVLDDPIFFYIPFEFLLIKFERIKPGISKKIKFFTVSSACLSFRFLFQAKPYIGFGDLLVKKYFQPKQIKGRLAHEKDLRMLTEL